MVRSNDVESMLEAVWTALHGYRESCMPEGTPEYDEEWDEICTAMAWIQEDLHDRDENWDEDTPPDDPNWEEHL